MDEVLREAIRTALLSGTLHKAAERASTAVLVAYINAEVEISYNEIRRIVRVLDEEGFFQLRYAAIVLAGRIGISKQTVYNCLSSTT